MGWAETAFESTEPSTLRVNRFQAAEVQATYQADVSGEREPPQ